MLSTFLKKIKKKHWHDIKLMEQIYNELIFRLFFIG